MKIAISNIAWAPDNDAEVQAIMQRLGVRGVEIAPTMVWPEPLGVDEATLRRYREYWADAGIEIVALQALLFGRPDLTIFGTSAQREECIDYLCGMIRLAAGLGAGVLVFGSPKNRHAGELPRDRAQAVAADFFRRVGEVAAEYHTRFCIEPNPPEYGCDFVQTAEEGCRLVQRVSNVGFGLHLDAAALTLNGESYEEALALCPAETAHFHISEPYLGGVGTGATDHAGAAAALRRRNWDHWVSIEQRAVEEDNVAAVERALSYVTRTYGGEHD